MPAADPKGLKRICLSCGARYYDFNKRPIVCPGCKVEFTIEVKGKGRRSRAANDDEGAELKKVEAEVEEIPEAAGEQSDVVSLEEVDEDDDDEADDDLDTPDPDLELDDDIGDLDDLEEDAPEDETKEKPAEKEKKKKK